jgi:hypothetical protein
VDSYGLVGGCGKRKWSAVRQWEDGEEGEEGFGELRGCGLRLSFFSYMSDWYWIDLM